MLLRDVRRAPGPAGGDGGSPGGPAPLAVRRGDTSPMLVKVKTEAHRLVPFHEEMS
jgi:hypothetical protein